MSATIDLHGPYGYEPQLYPTGTEYQPAPYVALRIGAPGAVVRLYLLSTADADALIAAAFTAKSLLNGDHTVYPEQPPPDAGDSE